eukprot:165623-Chlamydomonas_euryale.AAC.1
MHICLCHHALHLLQRHRRARERLKLRLQRRAVQHKRRAVGVVRAQPPQVARVRGGLTTQPLGVLPVAAAQRERARAACAEASQAARGPVWIERPVGERTARRRQAQAGRENRRLRACGRTRACVGGVGGRACGRACGRAWAASVGVHAGVHGRAWAASVDVLAQAYTDVHVRRRWACGSAFKAQNRRSSPASKHACPRASAHLMHAHAR